MMKSLLWKLRAQQKTHPLQAIFSLWQDYLVLCKPKVIALMILTSVIGMLLATDQIPSLTVLLLGNLGIALVASAAAAVNHVVDQKIDAVMTRTRARPMPQGRISSQQALTFAFCLAITGMLILSVWINALTAWLTLASLVGYAVIYTGFLKRATPQNIVIGGLAGAAPPLLGWTAVTGEVQANGLLLVLIIFAWTPPHFWALAIHRCEDYAKAGIPMLPVTHGVRFTSFQVLLYTLILLVVSMLPFLTRMSGILYLIGSLALGVRFLQWSWQLYWRPQDRTAFNTFKYSITYLMMLFLVLLLDHYVRFAVV